MVKLLETITMAVHFGAPAWRQIFTPPQNIPFLINVMSDEKFLKGDLNTRYIENNPQLLTLKEDNDLAHKLIYYLAEVNANGVQRCRHGNDGFAQGTRRGSFTIPYAMSLCIQ